MLRPFVCMFVLALLLLPPFAVRSETITAAMRAEDKRLDMPITLNEPRISIGELLQKLSDQTGINLQADPREGASGRKVFVCCDHQPLGDVMDALWSLLSYQPGVWKWERSGKPGAFRYEFAPTLAAKNLPQTLKDLSVQLFLDHAKTMLAFAAMSPEERKRNVAQLSASLLQKDDKLAQQMVDADGFTWNGLRAFMQALTPRQQQDVLRGDHIPVTLDRFPDETRAAFHQAWISFNPRRLLPDGQIVPYPEPNTIYFETRSGGGGIHNTIPLMWIGMGDAGSISVMGSNLEGGFGDKVQDLWMES